MATHLQMFTVLAVTMAYFIFYSEITLAESYRVNGNYFIRSSEKFGDDDKNIVGTITKGSEFKVLESKKHGKGEALKIEIAKINPPGRVQKSKQYWIYKPNKNSFTSLPQTSQAQVATEASECENCHGSQSLLPLPEKDESALQRLVDASMTNLDEVIEKYSASPKVQKMIDFALRKKKPSSTGFCYRSVKEALYNKKGGNGLISAKPPDRAAIQAKDTLEKKFGFVNLLDVEPYKSELKSPSDAPKGAILVYSSGRRCGKVPDCGHVEIKTGEPGEPGYVSDYYSKTAINETPFALRFGTKYKLIGVMIKGRNI